MIYSKYRISLDVRSIGSQVVLMSKRLETGREIHITLTEGLKTYTIADDCYAIFAAIKPDGNFLFNFCRIEDNTIIYTYTPQTTIVTGKMECEIRLYSSKGEMLTSAFFGILISDTIVDEGEVIESAFESDTVVSLVEEKVREHLVENPIATDATLTEPEGAANAKATGDAIAAAEGRMNEAVTEAEGRVSRYVEGVEEAFTAALEGKVGKEVGKALSTNDFTDEYKQKLDGIDEGANKYELGEKAVTAANIADEVKTKYFPVYVLNEWEGETAPYTHTATVPGLLETDRPKVFFVPPDNFDTLEEDQEAFALLYDVESADGAVTFYAKDKPVCEFSVMLEVSRI